MGIRQTSRDASICENCGRAFYDLAVNADTGIWMLTCPVCGDTKELEDPGRVR